MRRFWVSFIEPALRLLKPQVIVEVGAESGINTKRILEYCEAEGARCHIIDPTGIDNMAELSERIAKYGAFHKLRSLQVLSQISDADVYLLDGDHNWYTVYHELCAIREACQAANRKRLPVIIFHDILWPYGRRDLYYCPEDVPAEFRQPYERAGVIPGQSQLSSFGGYNAELHNAVQEGGPRNGVLTAIEDFVAEASEHYEFMIVPGFHGLGLLLPRAGLQAATRKAVAALFEVPAHLRSHIEAVEADRMVLSTTSADAGAWATQLQQELEKTQATLVATSQAANEAAQQAALEKQRLIEAHQQQVSQLEHRLELIVQSHSYRALQQGKRLLDRVVPKGSKREQAAMTVLNRWLPSRTGSQAH